MFTSACTRRWLPAAATTTAALALAAAPAGAARAATGVPAPSRCRLRAEALDAAARAVVCLVNAERAARGLSPLKRDDNLAEAARRHASDMARKGYFAHTSQDGETVGDRARKAGYLKPGDRWRVGENLGWGTGARATPSSLVDKWLESPRHRIVMLRSTYRELGVGVAKGAPRVTTSGLPGATYTMKLGVTGPATMGA